MVNDQFDPRHPEQGWHEAIPMRPPRHWQWLQQIVNWFWKFFQKKIKNKNSGRKNFLREGGSL